MNILTLIKQDHEQVKEVLEKMLQTTSRAAKSRGEMAEKLASLLTPHNESEEQVFYPKLLRVEGAHEQSLEAIEEHHVAKLLLPELVRTRPEDEHWKAKVSVFQEIVEHHIKEEEGEIFRLARGAFDREQLDSMGEEFVQAKQGQRPRMRRAA